MNVFAHGIDWREGDEVLMCSHEHIGGTGASLAQKQRHGITIRSIDLPSPPESVDQVVSLWRPGSATSLRPRSVAPSSASSASRRAPFGRKKTLHEHHGCSRLVAAKHNVSRKGASHR